MLKCPCTSNLHSRSYLSSLNIDFYFIIINSWIIVCVVLIHYQWFMWRLAICIGDKKIIRRSYEDATTSKSITIVIIFMIAIFIIIFINFHQIFIMSSSFQHFSSLFKHHHQIFWRSTAALTLWHHREICCRHVCAHTCINMYMHVCAYNVKDVFSHLFHHRFVKNSQSRKTMIKNNYDFKIINEKYRILRSRPADLAHIKYSRS